jgi:ribosomal-protein-alanine N-acetyltransferase
LLEGKTVNLRRVEKEDVGFMVDCFNNPDFFGEYNPITLTPSGQTSKSEWMKWADNPPSDSVGWDIEWKPFVIQKKDRTRIGLMWHMIVQPFEEMEIACFLVPSERGKGYALEATRLIVDYLFLSRNIVKIQVHTNVENKAAQKVLEKVGFIKEGTVRKHQFVRGVWTDYYLYSILREEWKEPKILTKTA